MSIVLVIPDIHAPFVKKGFLRFVKGVYKKYKCNKVVQIGDEVDLHSVSRHPKSPDGLSEGAEVKAAIKELSNWYKAFPKVDIVYGNHSVRLHKRAFEAGLPECFGRSLKEILKAPKKWNWHDDILIDGVLYTHGTGYSGRNIAFKLAQENMCSVVCGHIHSVAAVNYFTTKTRKTFFGLSVGAGVDDEAYAFAYGRTNYKKSVLGCGVVINGKEAIFVPFK